jgi:ABC-type multidrug transport system ATPase subunit
MSHFKNFSLDQILFENVSVLQNGLDPILQSVDLQIPMDQTVIIQSSNPNHAVFMLEVLSGRKEPQSGRILWNEVNLIENDDKEWTMHDLAGCYFENQRQHPEQIVEHIFDFLTPSKELIQEAIEHFELEADVHRTFKSLTYEKQKIVMLISSTLKNPQMLILEDPASGISEKNFLQFLDWIQRGQRQSHLRHVFMTNHHPLALRHLECSFMYLEDGLIYFEENQKFKKAVHF